MQAEIFEKLKKDEIKFISLQFADLFGVVKEIVIPVSKLEDAIENGLWFDGSSIEGFARIHESDLFLKPDLSTYSVIPWIKGEGKTACFICDIYSHNGKPFERDARYILKKTISELRKENFEYNVGPEIEFYIFRREDTAKTLPMDQGSYFDLTSHEGYKFIKEVIISLRNFEINVETSHHEVGNGQYEIDFKYGSALKIADRLLKLKYTIKKIAQMYGLHATFMPKPIMDAPGSGMHVHQSLIDTETGKNLFYNRRDKYKLSKIAYGFIAGQMKYVKEMCAILSPTVNSYKRLVSGFEAPCYITWGSMNRSSLIRVPKWLKKESARIELRCPDSSCNPYLAFAIMAKGGLEGIKNDLTPPNPIEENVYKMEESLINEKNIEVLPNSLWEAIEEMKSSKIVYETLGKSLFEKYIEIKTREWNEYKRQVTLWEIEKYMEMY